MTVPRDAFPVHHADLVIVGAGVAGLSCALAAEGRRVTLLTKRPLGAGGNSPWAQGGIAAAVGPDDSGALHARDTEVAGAGLCDTAVVQRLTADAPAHIARLVALGARFDRGADGALALGREAAHGRHRILHANGDATGAEIVRALTEAVRQAAHVTTWDDAFVEELLMEQGRVVGVRARHGSGAVALHLASAVVLATGGIGRVFQHTTNPPEATGDGLAMAARAGAVIADLEFVQFHPTALDVAADPRPLLTEALRGAGAVLVNDAGERFMTRAHADAELAPRDVVARAIWAERAAGRRAFLDARQAVGAAFPQRFPTVFEACRLHGIDPRTDLMPVTPAAHYHMGGVATDGRGRTSLRGLWACGEVASTGLHGANRLASNSLLEALVVGAAVASDVLAMRARERAASPLRWWARGAASPSPIEELRGSADRVRAIAWDAVGLVRDETGLSRAETELAAIERTLPPGESRNLAIIARGMATAARARRESRGGHFRRDIPGTREEWARRSFWKRTAAGSWVPASWPAGHALSDGRVRATVGVA